MAQLHDSDDDAHPEEPRLGSRHALASSDHHRIDPNFEEYRYDEGAEDEFKPTYPAANEENWSDNDSGLDRTVQHQLDGITFGALARAHQTLQGSPARKRKREWELEDDHEEKMKALRDRLQDMKNSKSKKPSSVLTENVGRLNPRPKGSDHIERSDKKSTSPSFVDEAADLAVSRSSKHAPAVQSSKRPVPRSRNVVTVSSSKGKALDPRFSTLSGPASDLTKLRWRYAFLDDYRRTEMEELRDAIGSDKKESDGQRQRKKGLAQVDEETRGRLKTELGRMENRARAEIEKERQERVTREWKRKEREKVQHGKKPYYLKNSEKRKLALADRFENLKGKEREKAMRKKSKKQGEREKRNMPMARRVA
ncbi:DUF947-domain-containing protein [Viridothelium virens]|uniref:rRNA biogenesis protein RRP36 n=1 Tax=Viridothelium virens TaxID=1048519 RepID=A0A6A6GY94_VIRVR|nr:DUF947-domain-containing protein [Viridothelium virens]